MPSPLLRSLPFRLVETPLCPAIPRVLSGLGGLRHLHRCCLCSSVCVCTHAYRVSCSLALAPRSIRPFLHDFFLRRLSLPRSSRSLAPFRNLALSLSRSRNDLVFVGKALKEVTSYSLSASAEKNRREIENQVNCYIDLRLVRNSLF